MADAAAVQFLLDNLSQLVTRNFNLISDSRNQVEQLTIDLEYFNSFLKYASTRKLADKRERESMRQIRESMYDVEDAMDAFVIQATSSRSKTWFRRLFQDRVRLDEIAERVKRVRDRVENEYGDRWKLDMTSLEISDDTNDKFEVPRVREENVVGFKDDADKIIGYLKQDTPRLDIISIVGMPGIGKSTLARKIFGDPTVEFEFPTRLWVYVSKFSMKDVFLSILREFASITDDTRSMTERELAATVKGHLERGKFLIVMDDVWSPEDWSKISAALPTTNHKGKVLITSRNEDVALLANRYRAPHSLRLLSLEESAQLLQYEVFGEPRWPEPDFEFHGKKIAETCKGLPLAIVIIGGIIVRKLASTGDHVAKLNAWKKFSERAPEYLVDDPARALEKGISMSYDKLPYHLRPCFLYLGMFPNGFEIPTWKLYRMWIAEGFVQEHTGFSLEETAESYLDELITRNLVAAGRRNSYGKVKSCRVHDFIWDFCKRQAGKDSENFLEEIRKSRDGFLTPVMNEDTNYRRLCIHSNILNFLASKPYGRRIRSFVCFTKEDLTLTLELVAAIPGGFKLLRVLDVKPIRFSRIPSDMYELLHLRYVHLSFNSKVLPPALSKLWNIQTLIVETSEHTLEIRADIWKMRRLRHVKTNAITTLREPNKSSTAEEGNSIIETLGTISPEACTDNILARAHSLRRVSIRGDLKTLLSDQRTGGSFDNMEKLTRLEKLKLQNDVPPLPPSEGALPHLPPSQKFPPNLKILTLSMTFLDWSQMQVLGSLENLEVLKLKEEAFTGKYWETADDGFPRLEVLFIDRTDLAVWQMSSGGVFPNLRQLELQNCDHLEEVPIEFARKPSLRVLILNRCRSAAASADKIRRLKMEADSTVDFKMSISPPIN